MAFDPDLADRIRAAMPPGIVATEKKMFGGYGFLVGGHAATSAYKDGGLMIRCAKEDWEGLLAEPGARPMLRKDKPVSGWVLIDADAVADDAALAVWVERGISFAAAQPPK